MGRVWLARDEVLRRDVAVKQVALPFGLSDSEREELRARTFREARAAARLNHPNVIKIFDVLHSEEQPWLVMEYVRSRSLLQVIEENGPLDVDQVAGVGLAVLSALDAASRAGVLHRDVKPSNVLIADDGRVVLTDFGSAVMEESEGAITRTGVIIGSPQYIAPERAYNGASTMESDLWSLGATLYAAVEGRPPYTRPTAMATLLALATKRPDPMRRAGPLKPVISGLLQKDPGSRMRPADVEQHLHRFADVQTTVRLRRVPQQRTTADSSQLVQSGWGLGSPLPAAEAGVALAYAGQLEAARSGPDGGAGAEMESRPIVTAAAAVDVAAPPDGASAPVSPASVPVSPAVGSVPPAELPAAGADEATLARVAAAMSLSAPPALPPAPPVSSGPPALAGGSGPAGPPGRGEPIVVHEPGRPPLSAPDMLRRALTTRRLVAAAAVAVLLFALAAVTYRISTGQSSSATDRSTLPAVDTPATAPAVSGASKAAPSPSPAAAARKAPPGTTWWNDRSGLFRVAFPTGWLNQREGNAAMLFCPKGGEQTLRVRALSAKDLDLMAVFDRQSKQDQLPQYDLIRMEPIPVGTAAEWEYMIDGPKGRLHALERAVVLAGRPYLVQWRVPPNRWAAQLPMFESIMDSLTPPAQT